MRTKRTVLILMLALTALVCGLAAGCAGNTAEFKFIRTVPQEIVYGKSIYFREYIPVEFGTEYTLYASYYDVEEQTRVEGKRADSLLFEFDMVTDYDFRLERGDGETLECSVSCVPETPRLSAPTEYVTTVGDSILLTDLLFWCNLTLENEDAEADPDFEWVFYNVRIMSSGVDGTDEEVSLDGQTSFTFEQEAVYQFEVGAKNKSGEEKATLICNTSDASKHLNDITGYLFEDDSIMFSIPQMPAPEDGGTVRTRINEDKFDAVYNADTGYYTIQNYTKDIGMGERVRLYAASAGGDNFSTVITAPDLVIRQDNIGELDLVTEGIIVLAEDIDMAGIYWSEERDALVAANPQAYRNYYFTGIFDGMGHTVANFSTGTPSDYNGGFFWSVDNATVKNVIFKNAILARSNSVVAGRAQNSAKYENVAVEVAEMNMYNAGVIAGASESNITYTNCLMYVRKNVGGSIAGSGFMGGFYCRSVVTDSVYAVTATELPLTPPHSSITTGILGDEIIRLTPLEAKEQLIGNMPTMLLNKAAESFFSGNIEIVQDEDTVIHIDNQNASLLLEATKATFILDEDIDLSGIEWNSTTEFSGTLDGNGHAIKNLSVTDGALFYTLNGATVKNLVMDGVSLAGARSGVFSLELTASSAGATFENVIVNVTSISGTRPSGLIGWQRGGEVIVKNVLISMPWANTNQGFISSHCGGRVIIENLYCICENELCELHSTTNNWAANPPEHLGADGLAAEEGTDYYIYDSAETLRSSAQYAGLPEFLKTGFDSIFTNN